ncbi:erythromycin esterase family protein [Colwelliaceae bacterium 6441]
MKILMVSFILAISVLTPPCYAEQLLKKVHPVELVNDDFSDLAIFGDALGDKRIVFLDELSHGEKEVFQLKNRLVQYLHQEKGFEVLLLEGSIYDVHRIWQNAKSTINEQAPGNIFYMYANSQGFQALFNYIDKKRHASFPLALSGFDGRLSGQYASKEVADYIKKSTKYFLKDAIADFDWSSYLIQIKKNLAYSQQLPNKEMQNKFVQQSYYLYDRLLAHQSNKSGFDSPQYLALLVKGLLFSAEERWGTRRHDENDIPMAENMAWLLDTVYPNKKVIVLGHYIHLNANGAEINRYANIGTELAKSHGDDIYTVHIAGAKGHYREFRDLSVQAIEPLSEHSIEQDLLAYFPKNASKKKESLFIDEHNLNAELIRNKHFFGHEYKHYIRGNDWQNHWDGMFLINQVSASQSP